MAADAEHRFLFGVQETGPLTKTLTSNHRFFLHANTPLVQTKYTSACVSVSFKKKKKKKGEGKEH